MPKGRYPAEFFLTADNLRPIEAIYARLDEFSMEYFADEPEFRERLDVFVVLPPVLYERQFVKGVLFSQGVDYLYELQTVSHDCQLAVVQLSLVASGGRLFFVVPE